jgi:hypothetical protein
MDRNERTQHDGQRTGFKDQERKVRAEHIQPQYTRLVRNPKQPFTDKRFQRILIDMWFSFSGGLLQPKFSYFVGSNGRLLVRAERRGGK